MNLSPQDLARCDEIAGKGLGSIRPFAEAVSQASGIPIRDICGQSKTAAVSQARQIVYFLAHNAGMSLSKIGRIMHRDHATVAHGIKAERKRRGQP